MPEMGEPVSEVHIERENNTGKWILLALAIIYVAGSLFLTLSLRAHLDRLSKDYAVSRTVTSLAPSRSCSVSGPR